MNPSDMPRWQRIYTFLFLIGVTAFDIYMVSTSFISREVKSAGTAQDLTARLQKPVKKVRIAAFEDKTVGVLVVPPEDSADEESQLYFIPEVFFDDVSRAVKDRHIAVEAAGPGEIQRSERSIHWMHFILLPLNVSLWWWYFGGSVRRIFGRYFAPYQPIESEVTFDDVAGIGTSKAELEQLVEMLRNPERFKKSGARIPHGYLFVGPPGTGKTLLAAAVAGEAGVPFFSLSGSEFVFMYVGVGASRVRDVFGAARQWDGPTIIFIDELDAVGRRRPANSDDGNTEQEQTLNQILVEMQGIEEGDDKWPTIVIGATNRPDILDEALLRPGRLDRHIRIDKPNVAERKSILEVTVRRRNYKLAPDVNLDLIARSMPGKTGADLAELLNRASILAATKDQDSITMDGLSEVRDEMLMGSLGQVTVFAPLRNRIAHHEAGHAVVAHVLAKKRSDAPEVGSISVLRDAVSFGRVMYIPRGDDDPIDYEFLCHYLAILVAGRVGELLSAKAAEGGDAQADAAAVTDGQATAGVDDDLRRAFELALRMVSRWGMSPKLGATLHVDMAANEAAVLPDALRMQIFDEARAMMSNAVELAKKTIASNRMLFDALTAHLNDKHVVRFQDLERIAAVTTA